MGVLNLESDTLMADLFEVLLGKNMKDVEELEAIFKQLTLAVGEGGLSVTDNIKKVFGIKYNGWGNNGGDDGRVLADCLLLDSFTLLNGAQAGDGGKLYFATSVGQSMASLFGISDAEYREPEEALLRYLSVLGIGGDTEPEIETEKTTSDEDPEALMKELEQMSDDVLWKLEQESGDLKERLGEAIDYFKNVTADLTPAKETAIEGRASYVLDRAYKIGVLALIAEKGDSVKEFCDEKMAEEGLSDLTKRYPHMYLYDKIQDEYQDWKDAKDEEEELRELEEDQFDEPDDETENEENSREVEYANYIDKVQRFLNKEGELGVEFISAAIEDILKKTPSYNGDSDWRNSNLELAKDLSALIDVGAYADWKRKKAESEKEPQDDEFTKKFKKYYASTINGSLETLMFRYDDLFASGFEMDKFAGIFTGRDLVHIKNGQLEEFETAETQKIAKYLTSRIMGEAQSVSVGGADSEVPIINNSRSMLNISKAITAVYNTGSLVNLYFPRKMLEISLGRRLTVDTESNNYDSCPEGKSWGKYKGVVKKNVERYLIEAGKLFLMAKKKSGMLHDDYLSTEALDLLMPYYNYFIDCMSNAIIGVEYNVLGNMLASLKVRFFDKNNKVNNDSFIPMLVSEVFGQSPGVDVFNDIDTTTNNVKTFTHERNHGANQAIPIFAYKAYNVLRDNGVQLNMETLPLGKSPKGTIVKNGSNGINLSNKVSHYVIAGSRAGKGVMTLNILGGALASGRPVFYLDNKPDMAAMFSEIAPGMVVVNGKSLIDGDIDFKQGLGYWLNIDSKLNKNNIPDYALEALGLTVNDSSRSWSVLGDVFYFRAFLLVIGFMLYSAFNVFQKQETMENNKKVTRFIDTAYGTNGFCLVVDEVTNTLEGFMTLLEKMACMQAPENFNAVLNRIIDENDAEKDKAERIAQKQAEGKSTSGMKRARPKDVPSLLADLASSGFSQSTYYATSFLKAIEESVVAISGLANAGFNDKSSILDVFVIGQNVERKFLSRAQAAQLTGSTAYASSSSWKGTTYNKSNVENGVDFLTSDIFAPLLALGKTPDGFFGANQGVGNDYFAQKTQGSKAWGRLDTKAGNFGYTDNFGESERSKIKNNKSGAESLKYFKPFLILNKNSISYVSQMYSRMQGAGINPEMVNEDNPELDANGNPVIGADGNPVLSRYIGFDEYVQLIDENNLVGKTINSSGEILNNFVQSVLGYNGTWFDLVTDLRMEYILNLKNIGQKVEKFGSLDADHFKAYNKYLKGLKENGLSATIEDAFDGEEDFDETDFINSGFSSMGMVDKQEDEIDIFGTKKQSVGRVTKQNAPEKLQEIASKAKENGLGDEDFIAILRGLQSQGTLSGVSMIPMPDGSFVNKEELDLGEEYAGKGGYQPPSQVGQVGTSGYNENFIIADTVSGKNRLPKLDFSSGKSSESLKSVVNYVTSEVVDAFGGIQRITSFGIESGQIKVNDVLFKIKGLTAEQAEVLPYDLRYLLSSGNVSGLFDYTKLLHMKNLRTLRVDSNTAYNHIRVAWGMRDIEPEDFFKKIKSLRSLYIDGKMMSQTTAPAAKNTFKQARVEHRVSRAQESFTKKAFGGAWGLTKNMATNKNLSLIERAAGTTLGVGLTATAGVAVVSKGILKGAFGGLKGAVKGVGEALQNPPK